MKVRSRRRLRTRLGRTILFVWFGGFSMLCAGMLARHLLALPAPTATDGLGKRLSKLASPTPTYVAVHVLSSECQCSQRVVRHLLDSNRPHGWHELVLWVGDLPPAPELVAKFDVRRLTTTQLAALGIEAAPILIAIDPSSRVLYSGGYTDRKQGPVFHDLETLAAARGHVDVAALPVFGCATSERLQKSLQRLPIP
jgi:hypothetical protein